MKNNIYIVIFSLLLISGCKHSVTDTSGNARSTATEIPELPYILEGDYTPDTGVMYKVIINGDTCFVTIDSIDDELHGFYYKIEEGSDCVERKEFTMDRHWKSRRQDALVYIYRQPDFTPLNDPLYRRPAYNVVENHDEEYGQALGYWCSMKGTDNASYSDIIAEGLKKGIFKTTQSLKMDIYHPEFTDSGNYRQPLILMMHGGGFYVGDKSDSAIVGWCRHFASMGYIAVSINYRLGFMPTKTEIARTGYMALQDAHAAMRYLVEHADQYCIDTNLIFVGGTSAGSITSLNLAFMRDKDRPKATFSNRLRDLGPIAGCGNSSQATFHIRAVANMWGAVTNLNILKNSNTNIISFHGDADQVVPYDNGYPFKDVSEKLGKRMFDRMYGSMQINKRAKEIGLRSELHTFEGQGHSLHHYSDGSWNQKNFEFIRDKMTDFFYEEIAGRQPVIEEDRNDPRHFTINDDRISEVTWHVEGGFILKISGNDIWVVWCNDAPNHELKASGLNAAELGFTTTLKITTATK